MTEPEQPRRGRQGIQGIQGIEGIEGPSGGKQGPPGVPGVPGVPGAAGKTPRVTWRDFWLFAITGFLLVVAIQLQNTVDSVQTGRMNGSRATCAIASAVSLAGKAVISGEASGPSSKGPPTRQDLTLQKLGFGTRTQRRALAQAAGRQYAESIASNVEKQLGTRSKGIVKPDGTFNCQALLKLGKLG